MEGNAHEKLAELLVLLFFPPAMVMVQLPLDKSPLLACLLTTAIAPVSTNKESMQVAHKIASCRLIYLRK